jgi:hypothetical protein
MAKGPEYYWQFPAVKQSDATECWAASLDWWSKVTPGRNHVAKNQLLVDYVRLWDSRMTLPDGSDNPDYGTMTPQNMKKVFEEARWNMKVEVIQGGQFTMNFINPRLEKGPLIIGFRRVGLGGHALCVYGATTADYAAMDPDGGKLIGRAASYYTQSPAILVGSPK